MAGLAGSLRLLAGFLGEGRQGGFGGGGIVGAACCWDHGWVSGYMGNPVLAGLCGCGGIVGFQGGALRATCAKLLWVSAVVGLGGVVAVGLMEDWSCGAGCRWNPPEAACWRG